MFMVRDQKTSPRTETGSSPHEPGVSPCYDRGDQQIKKPDVWEENGISLLRHTT